MHSPFEALARNIVYQQLNGTAAAAIHARVLALFGGHRLRPKDILEASDENLRGAGLSRNKMMALRGLASKTLDGTVPTLAKLKRLSDDEIIERLTRSGFSTVKRSTRVLRTSVTSCGEADSV